IDEFKHALLGCDDTNRLNIGPSNWSAPIDIGQQLGNFHPRLTPHDTVIRGNTIEDTGSGRQKTGVRIGRQAGAVTLEANDIRAQDPVVDERPRS
ncbi:MAG: hypothetical protein J0L84_12790, partial [Verrucomicrobia bacterium]|nr:hypothetical protein [Verrucomicrobiota bacterium]